MRSDFSKIVLFSVLSFMFSCKNMKTGNIETFEQKHPNGQIAERYERRKNDFAKEGSYQSFYENGTIKEQAIYRNDTLEGEHKFFYPSGTCEQIRQLRGGLFEGRFQEFFENGTIKSEGDYLKNAMHGTWKFYYPNGTLKEQVEFRDNEENGPFREFYENGVLKTEGAYRTPAEDWEGGKEDGELKEYGPDGQLQRVAQCTTGLCRTTWQKK